MKRFSKTLLLYKKGNYIRLEPNLFREVFEYAGARQRHKHRITTLYKEGKIGGEDEGNHSLADAVIEI